MDLNLVQGFVEVETCRLVTLSLLRRHLRKMIDEISVKAREDD